MANNVDGAPSAMGGDARVEIPAVMISKALGDRLKPLLAAGTAVVVDFKSPVRLEKPELIDTITSFSSQGPRSVDGHIKPEVAAPGYQIWSAKNGAGNATVALNGTSMAAPHVAGVAALLRQLRPADDTGTIKSLIVNTAKPIKDAGGLD
jgi:subtilisin family serine protease